MSIDEQLLDEAVRKVLELEGPLTFKRSATGKFNETYFLSGEELERPLVARVAPPEDREKMLFYEHRMMLQEPGIHRLLREGTSMPVPEILHFAERDPVLGRDFLIMEEVAGDPLGDAGNSGVVFRELGEKLRMVHDRVRAEDGAYGYLGEHRPMEPQSTWQEAFGVMWDLLIADIANCGGYEADEARGWRDLFAAYRDVFTHYEEPASLLHMDVWAENILCDSAGNLAALIDWDRALWGDPEIEFAVLDYCGISGAEFWEGYGRERPAGKDAEIRRIFYLLYEVQKYIVIRIARQGNPDGAEDYRQMAMQMGGLLLE